MLVCERMCVCARECVYVCVRGRVGKWMGGWGCKGRWCVYVCAGGHMCLYVCVQEYI